MNIDDVLRARRSVRAFKPDPVPLSLVQALLTLAAQAPSGTNIQPWKVHVATGAARERLVREVLAHRETGPADDGAEFPARPSARSPIPRGCGLWARRCTA